MSNLWRIKTQIGFKEKITSPSIFEAKFSLAPADFFVRLDPTKAKTCISSETKFRMKENEPQLEIEYTGTAEPLQQRVEFKRGYFQIDGNTAFLKVEIDNIQAAAAVVDWVKVILSQFLSVQLGVFSDISLIEGTISGQPITISYPGASYSSLVSQTEESDRLDVISKAANLVSIASPSYSRFVTSCFYYQHALRLLSPHEVMFPPYTVVSEVLLNLAKCVESLFQYKTRDELCLKIQAVGFSEQQVTSQLLSIIVVRNEFDIGHSSSGASTTEELSILRNFSNRSVVNVRALLLAVASRITENTNFLQPMSTAMDKENRRRLRRIKEIVSQPLLPVDPQTQVFIQASVG